MKVLLAAMLLAASGAAGAQALLEFPNDLAFRRDAVEAFAERAYRNNVAALDAREKLDRDPVLSAKLQSLMERVARAAAVERPESASNRWEVHSCRACGEQASAMAGGKLMVGEEFVAKLHLTDDELGFVLAHEAGHVVAEHTREFAGAARYFVDNGLRRDYWDIQRELDTSFIVQLRMAFLASSQEDDADYIGFILGSRAGLEPGAMLTLLSKLAATEAAQTFGSHPTGAHRLEHACAMMETARTLYARSFARQ